MSYFNAWLPWGRTSVFLTSVAVGIVTLTAIVFLLAVAVITHHVITDRERQRNRQRFEGAAILLAPFLVADAADLMQHVDQAIKRFGRRAVGLVLRRTRYDLKGTAADSVADVLRQIGEVASLARESRARREWKRLNGVRGLGECGGAEARMRLIEMLDDPSAQVRRAAREGLIANGDSDGIDATIASFLKDLARGSGWRRSFYARLAAGAPEKVLGLIDQQRLPAEDEKLALEAVGEAGSLETLPYAIARLSSSDPELRATAVRVIGKIGSASHVHPMIAALGDDAWFVRAAAARSLELLATGREIGSISALLRAEVRGALGRRLTDQSWWVRANAAHALSHWLGEGLETLFTAAGGSDAYARDAALAALAMTELSSSDRTRLQKEIARDQMLSGAAIPQPPQSSRPAEGLLS